MTPRKKFTETFGKHVFNCAAMKKCLPADVYENVVGAMEGMEKIKPEFADIIAEAMKEWAIGLGATHYTHWFQPLTGASAEKHDSFIDYNKHGEVVEHLSGKQLVQGEPDASSFPSGGLRSTYEARGYTGWDPSSPVFLWSGGDGLTLCIPSVFFSWTGDVLDAKIPLLRSDKKIENAALRLLKLTGISARHVFSTLGCEQEYFVIDRDLRNLRQDLVLLGKTVFGASPPKGQELQDHYLGSVKDRILCYMQDFETEALKLGIPVKTRHNEVAPAQHEVAPIYERSSVAVDHNILLMELMRHIAVKHNLSCLLHEKPFNELNGSGKHCNWSLSTDTGINLLDPTDTPGNNLHFLIILTAILHAVSEHSSLLRASIGSAANDYRLGGHEAPPAIMSVYLGQELEYVLDNIEKKGSYSGTSAKNEYDLGLSLLSNLKKDNTDRNRTSPFAFTGNKFEFRAVGSSASPSFPMAVLNAIVAVSLDKIVGEIEYQVKNKAPSPKKDLIKVAIPVIQKYLKASRKIRYSGDNYSEKWKQEAKARDFPNIETSVEAFEVLKLKKTVDVFQGILSKSELASRFEIAVELYAQNLNIEANLMVEMFRTQILPAAIKYQKELAKSIAICGDVLGKSGNFKEQLLLLKQLNQGIEKAIKACKDLEDSRKKAASLSLVLKGKAYADQVKEKCLNLRHFVDGLESIVEDSLWPLPKYRELLFMI